MKRYRHSDSCPPDARRDSSDLAGLPVVLTVELLLTRVLPISRRTLYTMISAAKFPAPDVPVDGRRRGWKRRTVQAWLDDPGDVEPGRRPLNRAEQEQAAERVS